MKIDLQARRFDDLKLNNSVHLRIRNSQLWALIDKLEDDKRHLMKKVKGLEGVISERDRGQDVGVIAQ